MSGLQPISSSVPKPSASGLRMHDYAICASGPGGAACSGCSLVVECTDSCDDDEPCSYWRG